MFIAHNFCRPIQWFTDSSLGQSVCIAVVLLIFIPLIGGCAGPGTGSGSTSDREGKTKPRSDVKQEQLEQLLDEQQRKRLKPTEKSPGPIMISLFSRSKKFSSFTNNNSEGATRRSERRGNRKLTQKSEQKKKRYRYMILLSKEWAYNNRPIQEPFLQYARPAIKIMEDWQMNRFLSFLEKNKFKQFPSAGQVTSSEVQNLSESEQFLTVWQGDRFRRIHFRDKMRPRIRPNAEDDSGTSKIIKQYSNRLIIGFIRAYNAAGRNRMQVNVGPSRQQNRLKGIVEQAGSEENQKLKEKLYKARVLHKKGKHRKAKTLLTRIMDQAEGTTYYVDVRNLLYSVNRALQNE